jgi:hypothetical protein
MNRLQGNTPSSLQNITGYSHTFNGRGGAEIDIIESINAHNNWGFNSATHLNTWESRNQAYWPGRAQTLGGVNIYDGNWHTFSVEWSPNDYAFFINGFEFARLTDLSTNGFLPFGDGGSVQMAMPAEILRVNENPNYIKLSTEAAVWSRNAQGRMRDSGLPGRQHEMLVDWVRVWNGPRPTSAYTPANHGAMPTRRVTIGDVSVNRVSGIGTGQAVATLTNNPSGMPLNQGSATFAWSQRTPSGGSWSNISGATGLTHNITTAQANNYIRVRASHAGLTRTSNILAPYPTVRAVNISGVPETGTVLTASTIIEPAGAILNSAQTPNFQWQQRWDVFGAWVDIPNATSASFTLTDAQIGFSVRVRATYSLNASWADDVVRSSDSIGIVAAPEEKIPDANRGIGFAYIFSATYPNQMSWNGVNQGNGFVEFDVTKNGTYVLELPPWTRSDDRWVVNNTCVLFLDPAPSGRLPVRVAVAVNDEARVLATPITATGGFWNNVGGTYFGNIPLTAANWYTSIPDFTIRRFSVGDMRDQQTVGGVTVGISDIMGTISEGDVISVFFIVGTGDPEPWTVTYDLNGGNINGNTNNIVATYAPDELHQPPTSPIRNGFVFSDWQISANYKTRNSYATAQWLRIGAVATGGKGGVSSADATWLARSIAGHTGFELMDRRIANLRGEDRTPDTDDVTMLARWLVGFDLEYLISLMVSL